MNELHWKIPHLYRLSNPFAYDSYRYKIAAESINVPQHSFFCIDLNTFISPTTNIQIYH
ncbi:hypothetical protein AB3U99_03885 [Niallia sp. JL1B1071]|uniref:hypothetical protein n=1 Tax=Niallia tiangongensis TaxID=3237105 RepID=UPI0037DC0B22